MSFLNPLFLFGLAAAAIPILIHLFTRRRPREVLFPSLEFLSEVHHSEIRRLKLKQWLLLLLRTLAIAALALAMARPALRGSASGAGRAATLVVALVDESGSMRAQAEGAEAPGAGAATLGDVARRAVEDLISTLGPSDELQIVPYDREPHPATPQPSGDVPRLRAAAHALAPGAAATDHVRALAYAGRALAESHALNRELFWVSDFQRSGLPDSGGLAHPAGPWPPARVYLIPIAPRSRANAALTGAALAPSESGPALALEGASFDAAPGDLAVTAREVSFASTAHAADTSADLGRGFLNLAARGVSSALIPLARLPEGGGVARLPDDALPLDNLRYFVSGSAATLHVLLREDHGPSPLRLALEAGSPASGIAVETVDAPGLEKRAGEADVIVLNDLERLGPAELQAVLDFWRAGGALLVALGTHADAAFWSDGPLRELGVGALGAADALPAGDAWRLRVVAAGHPVLAGFTSRPGEALTNARFSLARALLPGRGRALLEFDRAHAALIEAPHAMVLSAPLDPAASDFAVSGAFLPLVHQAVKVLAHGSAMGSLAPGDRYRAPAATGSWRITDLDGRDVPSELSSESGSPRLVSAPLEQPGLYRVFRGGQLRSVFAVNPDPRESDLAALEPGVVLRAFPPGRARVVQPGADLTRRVLEARYGRELWREMILLALALLLAEMVLARTGMGAGAKTLGTARRSA